MAKSRLEPTPTDELTKLPLPILPTENPVNPNWHHHFHPRNSTRLTSKAGGSALRGARLQRVDYGRHNEYHNAYEGPPLPKKLKDRFGLVVMSVAGYMPDQALDFSGDAPTIVPLNEEKRLLLQTSGQVRTGNHTGIRKFIRDYVMSQNVKSTNIGELTIEEFIYTRDDDRRRLLGHTLLGLIIDKATEPLDEQYHQAQQQRKIRPGLAHSVMRFTKTLLGPPRSRDMLVNQLHERLETSIV